MLDIEFEIQLFEDFVFTPSRVFGTHAADEVDVFAWDFGSADFASSQLATPVELESTSVPSNHSLGFDKNERCLPVLPESREPHPE